MKKRLLITSIVMMLVVAVALSTATYAWFTSNTSVTANQVILTASTMSGDAILISRNADNTSLTQEITLQANGENKLYPSTPLANTAFTTGFDSISEAAFQNLIMNGTGTFVAEDLTATAHTSANDKSYYTDTFYIYNKGFSAVTLTPVVTIYYDGSNAAAKDAAMSVRIALIEKKGTAVTSGNVTMGDAQLKGIYQYGSEAVNYIHPTEFSGTATYYSDEGTTQDTSVTSENFESKKGSIYVASGNKTVAAAGATSAYGVVAGTGSYTQGSVAFTETAMQAIAAPASGYYVANQYSVVVWLEGWDPQCTNAMSAGAIRVGLTFAKAV